MCWIYADCWKSSRGERLVLNPAVSLLGLTYVQQSDFGSLLDSNRLHRHEFID